MWYGNTKTLLESIVRGLKAEPPQNDAEWQAQTELVGEHSVVVAGASGPQAVLTEAQIMAGFAQPKRETAPPFPLDDLRAYLGAEFPSHH